MEYPRWVRSAVGPAAQAIIASPFGRILIQATQDTLVTIELLAGHAPLADPPSPLLDEAARQFQRYFAEPSFRFSLPLWAQGTPFQRKVWDRLVRIEPGTVMTYADVARAAGTGPRAVGGACRVNPYPIVIPCHRVVARGGMGGYCGETSGSPLLLKCWLLRHEGVEGL